MSIRNFTKIVLFWAIFFQLPVHIFDTDQMSIVNEASAFATNTIVHEEWFIKFSDSVSDQEKLRIIAQHDIQVTENLTLSNAMSVKIGDIETLHDLLQNHEILWTEPVYRMHPADSSNKRVIKTFSQSEQLVMLETTTTVSRVYILDDGNDHESQVLEAANGTVINGTSVEYHTIDITNSNGEIDTSRAAEGIRQAVADGASVINISWSPGSSLPRHLVDAVNEASSNGVSVIVASGNDGMFSVGDNDITINSLASLPGVTSVGSMGVDGTPEAFTSGIFSPTMHPDFYAVAPDGTSFSAPQLAALYGNVKSTDVGEYDQDGDGVWDENEIRQRIRDDIQSGVLSGITDGKQTYDGIEEEMQAIGLYYDEENDVWRDSDTEIVVVDGQTYRNGINDTADSTTTVEELSLLATNIPDDTPLLQDSPFSEALRDLENALWNGNPPPDDLSSCTELDYFGYGVCTPENTECLQFQTFTLCAPIEQVEDINSSPDVVTNNPPADEINNSTDDEDVPLSREKGLVQCEGNECSICHIFNLAQKLLTWIISIMSVVIALIFAIGGMKMVLSAGSEEKVTKARSMMTNAVVGFVILMSAWLIIDTVMKTFVRDSFFGEGEELGPWNEIECAVQPEQTSSQGDVGCGNPEALVAEYNGSPAINAPGLEQMIFCYVSDPVIGEILDLTQIYTFERSNPLCNLTNGHEVCGKCSHEVNSCHYGRGSGEGAKAVDFNVKEDSGYTERQLHAFIQARSSQCGGTVIFEEGHTHVSHPSC